MPYWMPAPAMLPWSTWKTRTLCQNIQKNGVAEFFQTLAGSVDYSAFNPTAIMLQTTVFKLKFSRHILVKATGKSFAHDTVLEFTIEDEKDKSFFAYVDSLLDRRRKLLKSKTLLKMMVH